MHTQSVKKKRAARNEKRNEKSNILAPLFHFQRTWVGTPNESLHLELAGQLLRRSLARKDYERAFTIYSTLIGCKASSEELMWKVGSEILSRNKEYEPLCLKFLQQVHLKSKICRESVLVELALYQMRCGQIQEARKTLGPNITAFPYSDNSQIQGYYGVIEFALYNMAIEERRTNRGSSFQRSQDQSQCHGGSFNLLGDSQGEYDGSDSDDDDSNRESSLWDARIMDHKLSAIKQLERALELDSRNDGFLAYLVRLKCGRVDMTGWDKKKASPKRKAAIQDMKAYLKRFYDNSNSMLALQLLAALESRKKRRTLELILSLNPAADSELYVRPLVELMWAELPEEQKNIISRISDAKHSEALDVDRSRKNRHSAGFAPKNSIRMDSDDSLDEGNVPERSMNSAQVHGSTLHNSEQQLDVNCIRPILQLLLTRAEFNALKPWEEQEIGKITMYFDSCR
ncbi:MAG: hypothetical protein J3R72DRAFT_211099 [Linnemannia gamsii]|nr:MAG: hypothetical protein J3R72DRAFT_211099 [Linnemannia gamsii]